MHTILALVLKIYFGLLILLCLNACTTNNQKYSNNQYKLNIGIDESIKPIASELLDIFKYYNPKIIIEDIYNNGTTIKNGFNNNKYDLIIINNYRSSDYVYLKDLNIRPKTIKAFFDATVFISNKNYASNKIDILNFSKEALKFNTIIIDSNINLKHYSELLKINPDWHFSNNKLFSSSINKNIITKYLENNALIITNLASILDPKYLDVKYKILAINNSTASNKYFLPSQNNLSKNLYPLVTEVVLVYKDTYPYISRGFADFTLGQISQLIIHKYGLLPTKLRQRTIEIKDNT